MLQTQMKNEMNVKVVREGAEGTVRTVRSDRLPPLPANFIVMPMRVLEKPEPIQHKADPTVSLEAVRQALGKVPGTLAQMVHAEREER